MSRDWRTTARQIGLLAAKDLKIFFLDRWAFLFAVAFPFVFVIIFAGFMGGAWATSDDTIVVYLATEEPEESLSQAIIDSMIAAGGSLDARQMDAEAAREALEGERLAGYLLFPSGFSDAVGTGEPAHLIVRTAPERSTARAALLSIGHSIVAEIRSYQVLVQATSQLLAAPGGAAGLPAIMASVDWSRTGQATGPGINLILEEVGKIDPPRPVDLLIPGYLTMFVFFALALTAETIAAERETYTLERLVAGTASKASIIGGKVTGSMARGVVQVVIFWLTGILIFHVRMGNHPWAVILISILLTLAAAGVGVFLAAVAKSRKAANSMGIFVSLSAAALGGSWWPLFIMPGWLQDLAKITPHAWANQAFNKLMIFGATPANVVPEMVALLLFGVVFFTLGAWRFRLN